MKEPKEYAKELKNRFYSKETEKYLGKFEANTDAVHFALICVNEIIEVTEDTNKYWREVKQEITKL